MTRVGNAVVASVQHVGDDARGPSRLIALDWRTGRLLVRRGFEGPVGPLAGSGEDLWALELRPVTLLRLDAHDARPGGRAAPSRATARRRAGRGRGLCLGDGVGCGRCASGRSGHARRQALPQPAARRSESSSPAGASGSQIVSEAKWIASSRARCGRSASRSTSAPRRPGWRRPAATFRRGRGGRDRQADRRPYRPESGPPIRVADPARRRPAIRGRARGQLRLGQQLHLGHPHPHQRDLGAVGSRPVTATSARGAPGRPERSRAAARSWPESRSHRERRIHASARGRSGR